MLRLRSYRDAKREYEKAQTIVQEKHDSYKKTIKGGNDETIIEEYYTAFSDATKEKDILGKANDYISMKKEIDGGRELKKLLGKFNKNKRKHLNKDVFVFMKALKTYAGDCTKGHGVHELSNAMRMQALEKRQDIYDTVINGCVDDDDVKIVMDWWLDCAGTLFHISVILKSQSKLKQANFESLKDLIANYIHK